MIPLKIELTNFLSYRETALLNFEGIRLACISGHNGAGKSSILDGMTWALFGKSRSKSDDDIINRVAYANGETAEVRLTFELDSAIYRIVRRKRHRRSVALEFQIQDEAEAWHSLSEGKVKETQLAIESLLRMNYDTFSNSSFLLQGKADAFTTKTPNQRKLILADLLGVSEWEQYREKAVARRRQVENRLLLLEGRMEDINAELADQPERLASLKQAEADAAEAAEQLQLHEALLEQARRTVTAIKQQQSQLETLNANIAEGEKSLARMQSEESRRQKERTAYQALLDEADKIRATFAQWEMADAAYKQWEEKARAVAQLQQQRHPHELAINSMRTRLEEEKGSLEREQQRVGELMGTREAVVGERDTGRLRLTQISTELTELTTQIEAWNEARAELQQLESERATQQRDLERLQHEQQQIGMQELAQKKAIAEQQRNAHNLSDLERRVKELNEQRDYLQMDTLNLAKLETTQPQLKKEMDELKERMDRLEAHADGDCPLCGQPLTAGHLEEVQQELRSAGKGLGDQYRVNRAEISALSKKIKQRQSDVDHLPRVEREISGLQQRQARSEERLGQLETSIQKWTQEGLPTLTALLATVGDMATITAARQKVTALASSHGAREKLEAEQRQLQAAVAQAESKVTQVDEAHTAWEGQGKPRLNEVADVLSKQTFAPEARAALAALERELTTVAYDAEAHTAVKTERSTVAEAPAKLQALEQAETAVRLLDDTLTSLKAQQTSEQSRLEAWQEQSTAVSTSLADLTKDAPDLDKIEQATFQRREAQIAANRTMTMAQVKVEVLEQNAQALETLQAERADVTVQIGRLQLLETACGRNGVQALLIEHALPELEARANELLQRLTDGAMQVTFQTQRKLKSRDEKAETLDIHLSDRDGERPYENYSGGEQFRVNFAIRLALSQLLSQRAGANLQTLVIDEGFGSQDPQGRGRLIEALNLIQDDFARILVITHIDELKEAFPTRINVEKGGTGSTIAVTV